MGIFNTPVLEMIKGEEKSFPRLLLADIEKLTDAIVLRRKVIIKAKYRGNGFKEEDLPRLMMQADLEDRDIVFDSIMFAKTAYGAKKVIELSWAKVAGRTGTELWSFLADEAPGFILDLAFKILSAPPMEKADEPAADPTTAGEAESTVE